MALEYRLHVLTFVLLLPLVALAIKIFGITKTADTMFVENPQLEPMNKDERIDQFVRAKRILQAMRSASIFGSRKGKCLPKSMTLHWVLQRQGISSDFKIGVRAQPKFLAHAWVEHQGIPLNASPWVRTRYQIVDGFQIDRKIQFQ